MFTALRSANIMPKTNHTNYLIISALITYALLSQRERRDVPGNYGPLIDIGSELDINNPYISGLVRNENVCFEPTTGIGEHTKINHMLISNCVQTCPENAKTEFLECKGEIKSGKLQDITVNGKTVFDKKF